MRQATINIAVMRRSGKPKVIEISAHDANGDTVFQGTMKPEDFALAIAGFADQPIELEEQR